MDTDELRELYQEVILDHSKNPRNFKALGNANHSAEGFNPLCGDRLKIYLLVEDNRIKDVAFQGSGCAISKSSASMMTAAVKGKSLPEVDAMFQEFHQMLSGKVSRDPESKLGKLSVFSGVCEFPVRVKCATLAWHALRAALESDGKMVSTEEEHENAS